MLINGLKPYISVKQVGSNTYGKNVGSFTIKDWIDNEGNVNPNHTWAMQPVVLKIANSQDFSDYTNGLVPDITAKEYASEMLPFGDPKEALLKICLDNIKGSKSEQISGKTDLRSFKSSIDFYPLKSIMLIDKLPHLQKDN